MKAGSAVKQGKEPAGKSGFARWLRWILICAAVIAVAGVGAFVFSHWTPASPDNPEGQAGLFTVTRGDLPITVTESGDIKALDSIDIKSEVEGQTTIISIVDEGTIITPEDVNNSKILVELDSSDIKEKLTQQEITFLRSEAELTEANERLMTEIEQRKLLERELLDISEREKRLIGQELHDSIGQQFTGIAFMTKVLEQKLAVKSPDEAAGAAEIRALVNEAMTQTRALAKGLHPVGLDAESLMSALGELAENTRHLFGVACSFHCSEPVPIHDSDVAVNLYRVAQEAVTNAIKHGKAKSIRIELTSAGEQSFLTVKNDGLAFSGARHRKPGMGLQIMNHRAEMISGSLDIKEASGGGTVVSCAFPKSQDSM